MSASEYWAAYREPAFWSKVEKSDGCWEWRGTTNKGYGRLHWKSKTTAAHRVAYELRNGEIQGDAQVLHKCDNRLCCNPDHLYLGTHADNMRDMRERSRSARCEANSQAKLTLEQARKIRQEYFGRIPQKQIAEIFNVSQHAISQIVRNLSYVERSA